MGATPSSMAYWRLHYHLIWTTYERHTFIIPALEHTIRSTITGKCQELRVVFHAIGNTADHVHVVVSMPPKLAVAECIRQFKGASSHAVNHMHDAVDTRVRFGWQDGYGALTVSEDRLRSVIEYVRNQKQHHAAGTLMFTFEETDAETT